MIISLLRDKKQTDELCVGSNGIFTSKDSILLIICSTVSPKYIKHLSHQTLKNERKSWYLYPMIILAVETAMRRGELLELSWQNIDFEKSCVLLPITKNGSSRWVPLTKKALVCLKSIKKRDEQKVFPLTDNAFRHAWNIAKIEWGWQLSENPIAQICFSRTNPPRERRLKS